ncbi:MAG: hypothetical protein CM1200mP28_05350 [Deltaproteobacteria bacterium]|nr:MAG: hypothetical protein CM1200mP28_05350 [Deltaproteobacteria bacterium]
MPTPKMVDEVRKKYPQLKTVTFKYEENVSHEELMKIAKKPFSKKGGPQMVVANRAEEFKPDGTQVAWLIQPENKPRETCRKGRHCQRYSQAHRIDFLKKFIKFFNSYFCAASEVQT